MELRKIKVYLQYPWKFPDSPYYKYLVESPPKGVKFLNVEKEKGVITNKSFFWFSNFLKRNIRRWANKFNLAIPNAHLSPKGDYDLIHCAHCLSKNGDKPWVADIESYFSFFLSGELTKSAGKKIKNKILNKHCKRILPWTNATKIEILERIPEVEHKIEVLYPAVPFHGRKNNLKNKRIKIIYASRYFWIKGGLIALETLSKLKEYYDIDIIFIANVPSYLRKKYSNLEIIDVLPQKRFLEELSTSDIFFYPSLVDTFGFGILEAMSFGVVPVAINSLGTKSVPEIISDGKTGMIVNASYYKGNDVYKRCRSLGNDEKKVIRKLVKKMMKLIKDTKLRAQLSKNCLKEIESGKFSIKLRNEKLKKIYTEALEK